MSSLLFCRKRLRQAWDLFLGRVLNRREVVSPPPVWFPLASQLTVDPFHALAGIACYNRPRGECDFSSEYLRSYVPAQKEA
jgi:hypothetical protein